MSIEHHQANQGISVESHPPIFRLDVMTQDDVQDVSRVERRCFPNPWPTSAYRRELQNPAQSYYIVLRGPRHGETARMPDYSRRNEVDSGGLSATRSLPRRSLLPIALGRRNGGNGSQDPVIGFGGMWLAFDEAHVTTIGVDPHFRSQGLGELLFLSMVDEAVARGANWLTLEVRVSNDAAQALYRKYGFTVHGTRKRYYSDNNEDAHIMWSRALSDPDVRADFERHRGALAERLSKQIDYTSMSPFTETINRARTS